MTIEVVKMTDNSDGSCDIELELDAETILKLAKIGLEYLMKKKAEEIVNGHTDPTGSGDT